MTDMNSVNFTGRVVKDAEMTKYANDLQVANFTVVINRDCENGQQWEEKPIFVDLALFGKSAESYLKHLTKGKVIGVEGHLDMDRWTKDDKQFTKLKVVIDRIYPFIAGSKKSSPVEVEPPAAQEAYADFPPPPDAGETAIF